MKAEDFIKEVNSQASSLAKDAPVEVQMGGAFFAVQRVYFAGYGEPSAEKSVVVISK